MGIPHNGTKNGNDNNNNNLRVAANTVTNVQFEKHGITLVNQKRKKKSL